MSFITKINLQDNRQHQLPKRSTQALSGTTEIGVAFSALTSAPDLTTSGTSDSILNVFTTFSGNSGTTVFAFGDSRMDLALNVFSAVTSVTSGVTQASGDIYIGDTSQTVDGNLAYLTYTGVSFDLDITATTETAPGIFTGSGVSDEVFFLSAGTLDFTGRTIWSDVIGISRTEKLIVSDTPVNGYVFTSDSEGMGSWQPSSGSSAEMYWTAGTGTAAILQVDSSSYASGDGALSQGISTTASGDYSHAEGKSTNASGTYSHAEGSSTTASGTTSHAEGNVTIAGGAYSHAEGLSTTASGDYAHAEGRFTIASNNSSHAEGRNTTASGFYSHSEGYLAIASGNASHAEGQSTTASGDYAHAEGNLTTASSLYSHAEGNASTASGTGSHAEGSNTTASGIYSHAEGESTTATGTTSHAEGSSTNAFGYGSHSEGISTTASANYSHSEGNTTTASALYAHSEGRFTIASGQNSHAEGDTTTASGAGSHAEGVYTIASGTSSHSAGYGTVAGGDYSFMGGKSASIADKIEASGIASFGFFTKSTSGDTIGARGDASAILGGKDHDMGTGTTSSAIFGGESNLVNTDVLRSVIIGGTGITATTTDMVYVPDLVIDGLTSTDPIATDVNGKIVAGTSDRRLKKNIQSLTSGLDKIKSLRGVSFEYTEESNMGSGLRYGFIAQEVQEHIPDAVRLRSKGDGMLSLNYTEIVPWLVEAVKEITNGGTITTKTILETQTIIAEDNNIELNYGGNHTTALGGGIIIKDGIRENADSFIKIDDTGRWIIGPALTTSQLTLPEYTPDSTRDDIGSSGDVVWDDEYLYIKTNFGWRRSKLETF